MPKILIAGHSHLVALRRAVQEPDAPRPGFEVEFLLLREKIFEAAPESRRQTLQDTGASTLDGIDRDSVRAAVAAAGADATVLALNGNGHNVFGLFKGRESPVEQKCRALELSTATTLREWLGFLLPLVPRPVVFQLPPPPIESEELARGLLTRSLGEQAAAGLDVEPPEARLALWRAQNMAISSVCASLGVAVLDPPAEALDSAGHLLPALVSADPTHASESYGRLALAQIGSWFSDAGSAGGAAPASGRGGGPYAALPDHCFWRQSVGEVPRRDVDPVVGPCFRIRRRDLVATAGSCFAQHISRRLRDSGYSYFVAEPEPQGTGESSRESYYDFSARYGNIYTARQLLQLFDRAFGYFRPLDRAWERKGGGFCDPFRPRIEPRGYPNEEAVAVDQRLHLAAVRRMFRELDVFVFTLGLTESWISRLDGAVYPVAPGVAGGTYTPKKHVFHNFSVAEVVDDLRQFLAKLQLVNPAARVILTVSPVPLVATASGEHVLQATVYSKSVLRVAAAETAAAHDNVFYFPSYEIIIGPHAGGAYLEADLRSVTPSGVDHVMRVFMAHLAAQPTAAEVSGEAASIGMDNAYDIVEALCDEEMLAR